MLSDQGSNFMSMLMKRVMEILQTKQLRTSPYHPECNGMLERFHATLKAMLRKTSD
jgi:transposase InsO family protein